MAGSNNFSLMRAAFCMLGIAVAMPVFAQWNLDPTVRNGICISDSNQSHPAMCSDGHGGAIIAWEDLVQNNATPYIYAQRVDDRGYNLWDGKGIPLTTCYKDMQHAPHLCPDGLSGAFIAWYSDIDAVNGVRQIYAMHLDSNGNRTWKCDGMKLNAGDNATFLYDLFPDRSGGFYMVWGFANSLTNPSEWNTYVSRIDSSGAQVWGAPTSLDTLYGSLGLYGVSSSADTLGNVYVSWTEALKSGKGLVKIQKVTPSGAMAWINDGLMPVDSSALFSAIAADNLGGAFITTCNSSVSGSNAKIIHVNALGIFTFTTTVFTDRCTNPSIISDGYTGAIASWLYGTPPKTATISCARVDAKGKLLWPLGGKVDIADPNSISIAGPVAMVSDGMRGAMLAWYEQKPPIKDLYATRIDSSGKLFWGKTGKPVCTQADGQEAIVGVGAFPDQIICAWSDYRDTAATGTNIFAAKLGDPWFAPRDTIINYGRVNIGDTSVKNIILRNIGVEPLTIANDNYIIGNNTQFELLNDTPNIHINYRDTVPITAAFNPLSRGPQSFDVKYTSNTKFKSPTVHLRGVGVVPQITTTGIVNFGTVVVNGSSALTIQQIIHSAGDGFLHIDSMRMASNSGSFVIDSGNVSPIVVDSGISFTMKISFHPKTTGNIQDSLLIYNNTGSAGVVHFVGTGSKGLLVFTASVLDFGDVTVGDSLNKNDTAIATSQKIVKVRWSETNGSDFNDFSIPFGVAPFDVSLSSPHSLTLQFKPLSAGEKNSSILLYSVTGDSFSLPVRGNGIARISHKPVLNVFSNVVDFGDTLVGMKHDSLLSGWLRNNGDTTLFITGMSIIGPNAADFTVEDSAREIRIEPGTSAPIIVHFSPQTPGNKLAHLSFVSNSAASPTIDLLGRGFNPLQRGELFVVSNIFECGSSHVLKSKTISAVGFVHNIGTGPLEIETMTIKGANATEFQIMSKLTYTIAAGDSATVSVQFTPTGSGLRTATLTFYVDGGDSNEIALEGSGTLAKLALTSAQIDFGNVPLLVQRDTLIPTFVMNVGTDTALITNVAIIDDAKNVFGLVQPVSSFVLAPQESAKVECTFLPTHTGIQTATLLMESGGDTSLALLSGRGVRQLGLTMGSARGTPGTVVIVPLTADSSLAGTSVTGMDFSFLFSPKQFYPQRIVTTGTSSEGWNFKTPLIVGDTAFIHGTGLAPLQLGRHVCDLEGLILQSDIIQAPISVTKPFTSGDADVTMIVTAAGTITMDTICGYGDQSFTSTTAALLVWAPTPNPATNTIQLPYRIGASSDVSAVVRDEQGRVVSTQAMNTQAAGDYAVSVDTHALTPGMYFLTIFAAGKTETRKFVITK